MKKQYTSSKKSNGTTREITMKRLRAVRGGGALGITVDVPPPRPELMQQQHNETLIRL